MKYQSLNDQKLYGPEFYARISVTSVYRIRCSLTTVVDIGPLAISVIDEESCHWDCVCAFVRARACDSSELSSFYVT
jgi:hypothetical protein